MKTKQIKITLEYVLEVPADTTITSMPNAGLVLESAKGKFTVVPAPTMHKLEKLLYTEEMGSFPQAYHTAPLTDDTFDEFFLDNELVMSIKDGKKLYKNKCMF